MFHVTTSTRKGKKRTVLHEASTFERACYWLTHYGHKNHLLNLYGVEEAPAEATADRVTVTAIPEYYIVEAMRGAEPLETAVLTSKKEATITQKAMEIKYNAI